MTKEQLDAIEAQLAGKSHLQLYELARECLKLRKENVTLLQLCNDLNGFVKSYGLSDEGPNSEWDRWKDCVDTLHSLLRKDAPKPEQKRINEVIARWTVNKSVDTI